MFIGRERDLKDLESLWGRDHGVLVTCRGRRRIGKSTLIEEFASRSADKFICIEGLPPRKGMTDSIQRKHAGEYVGLKSSKASTSRKLLLSIRHHVVLSSFTA